MGSGRRQEGLNLPPLKSILTLAALLRSLGSSIIVAAHTPALSPSLLSVISGHVPLFGISGAGLVGRHFWGSLLWEANSSRQA